MKAEFITVTPTMAKMYLSRNTDNRLISDRRVEEYVADLIHGNWKVTHQGIAFYDDGTLADGQHRLLAIVRANKPAKTLVTTGLPRASSIGIDRNRPRSAADSIRIGKLSDWIGNKEIAMINVIANPKRLSVSEQVKWLNKMETSAKFVAEQFATHKYGLTNSSIMAAVALAHYHGGSRDDLIHFCQVFYTGMPESKRDEIIVRLRDEFMRNTGNGGSIKRMKYLKAQRALEVYLKKVYLKRLVTPEEAIWTFDGDAE